MPRRPSVVIVSPALAAANNGNWQTASRWARWLAGRYAVRIVARWPDAAADGDAVMIALHARRSAESVEAWAGRHTRRLAVVLTGTDLYQDIADDRPAQRSLALAQALVVLQPLGLQALPSAVRGKARVIYQSCPARQPLSRTSAHLTAIMVGHLRAVKSPETLFEAARLLRNEPGIRLRHIGAAQEAGYEPRAREAESTCPGYRWLGPLPHEATRRAIQRAHVLVHASALEGGAHVIMEAVRSGTPVLASRVAGNVGMLGEDYAGYFPHGDAAALADLLRECRAGQQAGVGDAPPAPLLARLAAQCDRRAPLFAPETERAALLDLVAHLQDKP